ncbi:hypothetical protein D9757_004169 [Collybiopsis confluens]|uniref:CTLH domain-containing protein n=1 Tax=Collybiopsis confluens TaxID=2823264 RepID=A0A8H5HU96_9AGAR|nr:hypothetical protein D9757_004169 [Collybiopsis confluens]
MNDTVMKTSGVNWIQKACCCSSNRLPKQVVTLFILDYRQAETITRQVPYENYRKVFRTSQKHIEREYSVIQSSASDISSSIASGNFTAIDLAADIDNLIGRVDTLKRKLSDLHESAGKPTQDVIRERLQHLASIESLTTASDNEYAKWADKRLDRWLVDWCLRHGKEKTARQIAREKDIEPLVDLDLFSDIRRVEHALSDHSCTEALAWCSENKASLRKVKASNATQSNTLEFDLRLQEYIELCRDNRKQEAIQYMHKHLISWQETHLVQIQHASGLLAFPSDTTCRPYVRLYDPSRWITLIKSFRRSIYALNTLPSEPLLNLALYAGLASLKLPACYDHSTKNVDCPVCDGESRSGSKMRGLGLGKLAEEVPSSYHANSTIVCHITKKIMDADNMPMAFPNGYVYSREVSHFTSLIPCRSPNDAATGDGRYGNKARRCGNMPKDRSILSVLRAEESFHLVIQLGKWSPQISLKSKATSVTLTTSATEIYVKWACKEKERRRNMSLQGDVAEY